MPGNTKRRSRRFAAEKHGDAPYVSGENEGCQPPNKRKLQETDEPKRSLSNDNVATKRNEDYPESPRAAKDKTTRNRRSFGDMDRGDDTVDAVPVHLPSSATNIQSKELYEDTVTADSFNKGKNKTGPMSPTELEEFLNLQEKDNEYGNEYYIQKGKAVIFNHNIFHEVQELGPRKGTEKDVEALSCLLKEMQFDVDTFQDFNTVKIQEKCKEVAEEVGKENWDALIMVVLTHGASDGKLYAHDTDYDVSKLWSCFTPDKCPGLKNKPKIFLIQACRGTKFDKGVADASTEHPDQEYAEQEGKCNWSIPTYADFIFAFSTFPNYLSWRNPRDGTWFIQAVCYVFHRYRNKDDLLTLLTRVNRIVADMFTSDNYKQIPYIDFTLRKKVWLKSQDTPSASYLTALPGHVDN